MMPSRSVHRLTKYEVVSSGLPPTLSPSGLYVVGTGVPRATHHFAAHTPAIEESMVPSTLAGELLGLAGLPRNAPVVAERPAVLWRLTADSLREP
ncbi:hypothetical protein V8E53_009882 [Lactarius tabidus]